MEERSDDKCSCGHFRHVHGVGRTARCRNSRCECRVFVLSKIPEMSDLPDFCENRWGGGDCGHRESSHGPRGDCLVPECRCAVYKSPAVPINTEPGSNTRLQKWVDPAMFMSEPLRVNESGPKVYLLSMNTDPLGSIAACAKMYKGEVVRDLADVTDDERRYYLEEMQKTKLAMPLESVQLHFMIEGVTRGFTHQLVRQRTAAYAQESMRFAVVEDNFTDRVQMPPSLSGSQPLGTGDNLALGAERNSRDYQRNVWDEALRMVEQSYQHLIDAGMPAEDARGLLPTNITTRVHYITNLRGLLDHAGNRLCTQAQFEWRLVFARISEAIRSYQPYAQMSQWAERTHDPDNGIQAFVDHIGESDRWQFEAIAGLLKPVCYQIGKCAFEADFDRKCSIRDRVKANHDANRPPSHWDQEHDAVDPIAVVAGVGPKSVVRTEAGEPVFIGAIQPAEWLLDPGAAR